MYKQQLCLGLSSGFELSPEEQISLLRNIGFEGIFIDTCRDDEEIKSIAEKCSQEGMIIQSLHAPFDDVDKIWDPENELGDIITKRLIGYLEKCSEYEIPVMVSHVWIGFEYDRKPNQIGIERFGKIIKKADELGVKLALENTEGEEFLEAVLNEFKGEKSVGFCWDSGHEQCYNDSNNLLEKYGDKLFSTHLNDNLGVRDFKGKTTFIDDLHLLPFDGIIDWKEMAERLVKCGFDGPLTFELKRINRGRRENLIYEKMTPEEYLTEAYKRACRVAFLKIKADNNMN